MKILKNCTPIGRIRSNMLYLEDYLESKCSLDHLNAQVCLLTKSRYFGQNSDVNQCEGLLALQVV